MFLVRGQDKNETYLKEVDCTWQNLRSQAVIILVKRGNKTFKCKKFELA